MASEARIQPVRSPPQWDLLSEPMVTTAGLKAATGVVSAPSRFSSRRVSSTTRTVPGGSGRPDQLAALGVGHQLPVGLWKSGTT